MAMAKMGDFHLALVVGDVCVSNHKKYFVLIWQGSGRMNGIVVIQTSLYDLKADNAVIKAITHKLSSYS